MRRNERGLTLIEILLALIIMVLGILGILALFPPALESAKESMEETTAAILGESVAQSLSMATRFAQYDSATGTYTVVFTHDLKNGVEFVKYAFPGGLPLIADGWRHHPGDVAPTAAGAGGPKMD